MNNRNYLTKKLRSSKLSLLVTSIIASALDLIMLIIMLVNGYEIYYVKCTLVLAIFSILFALAVWYSNFRFKYTITYIVLYLIVCTTVVVNQAFIYYPSDGVRVATDVISSLWLVTHAALIISVFISSLTSRNTFKPRSIIFSSIQIGVLGIISFAQLVLVLANGVFGHGAGCKTIVYATNGDGTLLVSHVLVDNNDTILIPETYNGKIVSAIDARIFNRKDIKNFVFETNGNKIQFKNINLILEPRTDITISSDMKSLEYLKDNFYLRKNTIFLGNLVVPNDLAEDKVYVNFTYDEKSLELLGDRLPFWVGNTGDEFSFSEYADEHELFNHIDHTSTSDLLWCINNTNRQILIPNEYNEASITSSVDNCPILFENIYSVNVLEDNDSKYEITDEYKYSYFNGVKQDALYCTPTISGDVINSFPVREGFTLGFTNNYGDVVTSESFASLLKASSNYEYTINPAWAINPIEEVVAEASDKEITYGDNVTFSVTHNEIAPGFQYEYIWKDSALETIGTGKTFNINNIINAVSPVFTVYVTATHPNSSLSVTATQVVEVVVNKKELTPIWVLPEDNIYDGNPKVISATIAADQFISGDNQADFDLYSVSSSDNDKDQIDAGSYQYKIILGNSLSYKYEIKSDLAYCSLVINQRVITPIWTSNELIYNGNGQRPLVAGYNNVISADEADLITNTVYDGSGVAAGEYVVRISLNSKNYIFDSEEASYSFRIVPKKVTAVWETPASGYSDITYIYNGNEQHPMVVAIDGTVNDSYSNLLDVISYTGATTDYSESSYTCVASLPNDSNYIFTNESASCQYYIAKRPVNVVANEANGVYGDEDSVLSYTVYDGINSSVLNGVEVNLARESVKEYDDVGLYNIEFVSMGSNAANYYCAQYTSAHYRIAPREIVVDWSYEDCYFDGTEQSSKITASYKDINGVNVPLTVTLDRYFINAGTYTATITLSDSNYCKPSVYTKQIVMNKCENSITTDFAIDDWNYGEEPSIPTLPLCKYGDCEVRYFSDSELTAEVTSFSSSTPAGTYYVLVVTHDGANFTSVTKTYSFTIGEGLE